MVTTLDPSAMRCLTPQKDVEKTRESRAVDKSSQSGTFASVTQGPGADRKARQLIDWRRKMSDHIAYALLVYTALQIFVTIGALKSTGASLLPYLALIILVIAIIPACRRFEARWNCLTDDQARDPSLARFYHRDRAILWVLAIGLPFAITGMFKGLALLFA